MKVKGIWTEGSTLKSELRWPYLPSHFAACSPSKIAKTLRTTFTGRQLFKLAGAYPDMTTKCSRSSFETMLVQSRVTLGAAEV